MLLHVNIELTQYLRLHKFISIDHVSLVHRAIFRHFYVSFFSLYFLNLSKYCDKPIYMYMVLMEAYFFLLGFFFF